MEITPEIIHDQINQVGAHLEEVRTGLEGKADIALLKEAEARIAQEMTAKFVSAQEASLRAKQDEEFRASILGKIDQLDTMLQRGTNTEGNRTELIAARGVFADYVRLGATDSVREYVKSDEYRQRIRRFGGDLSAETRALSEGSNPDGGYLVNPVIEAEIIKSARNFSPLRSVAKITSIASGNSLHIPFRSTGVTGTWESESGTGTESSAVYGRRQIPVHPAMVKTQASRDFLADAENAEQEVALEAAEAIGILEGTAFVSGTGVGRPLGFTVDALNTANQITGADAANDLVAADDFYTLLYGTGTSTTGLQSQYRANATFVMNSNVLCKALKLKDDNNNYLWNLQQGLQAGVPTQIAGAPFLILEDMQSDGTNANIPLAVADWQRAYRIVDRSGLELIRDPYSAKPDVQFMWRFRVGGQTVDPSAIRLLVV